MGNHFDVIIVGGGPAGLSAALLLGRSLRRVIVFDTGRQRNLRSEAMHGYLSRDGVAPRDFLREARAELKPYDVQLVNSEVAAAACQGSVGFEAFLADGTRFTSRKLMLATGVVDRVPRLDGIETLYGKSVFHCPYCDGWEMRGRRLAVYGRGQAGMVLASTLKLWSPDVVLCTHGGVLSPAGRVLLEERGITVRRERIVRLEGRNGQLQRIHFRSRGPIPADALFFTNGQAQRSDLPRRLGCPLNRKGAVTTDRNEETPIPGLYVVGDMSKDMQLVIIAAAEGARAAISINKVLIEEDQAAGRLLHPLEPLGSGL